MLGIGDKAAEVPVESYEVECCLGMFIIQLLAINKLNRNYLQNVLVVL